MTRFDQIVTEHRQALVSVALSQGLSREDAEDLVQDLYVKLYANGRPELDEERNPGGWLANRLRWDISDWRRANARLCRGGGQVRVDVEAAFYLAGGVAPDDEMHLAELRTALACVPVDLLDPVRGESAAVRVRRSRLKRKLRKQFQTWRN